MLLINYIRFNYDKVYQGSIDTLANMSKCIQTMYRMSKCIQTMYGMSKCIQTMYSIG